MEKKTRTFLFIALGMVALLGIVSAFGGFRGGMSSEDRERLRVAVESGDYDTWASIKRAQITPEKFNEMREWHQKRAEFRALMQEARESGNYTRMQELKAQYGVGKGMNKMNRNSGSCPFAN